MEVKGHVTRATREMPKYLIAFHIFIMAGIKSALVMIINVVYLWSALSAFVMEKARFVSVLTGKHDIV